MKKKDHKEDQSVGSKTSDQKELIDTILPIDISSTKLERGAKGIHHSR